MGSPRSHDVREVDPDTEDVLLALAPRQRRLLVAYLENQDADVNGVDALVDHLTDQSAGLRAERQVELALHHVHLPLLEAHGLLEYAPEQGRVRYDGHPLVGPVLALVGTG